jgi:hypothetical protein
VTSPDRPSDRRGSDPTSRDTALGEVGRHAGHGLTIALSTALFAWLGDWLDGRLGTTPLFVLLGAGAGFAAGFYSMYRQLVGSGGEDDAATEPEEEGPDGAEEDRDGPPGRP